MRQGLGPAVALASILTCLAPAQPARAQMETREGIQLQNQILELRRDLQALQQRGAAPSPYYSTPSAPSYGGASGLQAQLLERVQTLEDQVRQLRGQLDEQTNTLRVAQERLSKQLDDLNFRLGNASPSAPRASPQGDPGSAPTDSRPQTAPPQPPPQAAAPQSPPPRTPELALQDGNAALARRDYAAAAASAREVLGSGSRTPRRTDANFLLAQALLGQRNYQGAAVAYDDAYNAARTGSRAPDALLGLANALTGLNEKPSACATLEKLRREFPSARGAVASTAETLRKRNGCL